MDNEIRTAITDNERVAAVAPDLTAKVAPPEKLPHRGIQRLRSIQQMIIETLAAGHYLLRVEQGQAVAVQRFSKE